MNAALRENAPLVWQTAPLAGRVLIEASAGTGKTWNIGLIFLRLILEHELPIEKILVVTFTEAAAQELRERLRRRLIEAESCLLRLCETQTPVSVPASLRQARSRLSSARAETQNDELAAWLAHNYGGEAAKLALRRIQLARVDIDRAPIATIHAVCQRILREYPLDAANDFGADRLFDETELLRECIEDFWRKRYLSAADAADEEEVIAKGAEGLLFDLRDMLARDAVALPLDPAAPVRARVLLDAFAFCRGEIAQRARRRRGQTYSMLIGDVYDRVCNSRALAHKLFEAFPAALIDEFQDTDRKQFAIFDRIYRDDDGNPRGLMVMIGDPKQAIYAFRGGDIAAYLSAREQATARFSLAINHRSSTALVDACNALYAHGDGGFEDARVAYQPVAAARSKGELQPYAVGGKVIATPLFIHPFRGNATDAKGELLDKLGDLEPSALIDCTARIVELLNDRTRTIGGRPVAPGDIAVLLPQNRQVAELRKLLIERKVPCVGSGRGSVFDTDIARELELVFYAVLNAEDERAVRGALATRLLGGKYADIIAGREDSALFEAELERFADWRGRAHSRGVLAFLRDLIAERGSALLAMPDGERLLTDLRHLGEALAEQESASGLDGAYAWFAAIRREGENEEIDAAEARQLRIESDAKRVQLMTLHAAKGLEFPIVFLPLAWRIADRAASRKPKILYFHDDAGAACVDAGSAEFTDNYTKHYHEDLQERLRLLYVALTRASHAVHVYWVDRKQAAAPTEAWQRSAIDVLIRQAQHTLGLPAGESALEAMAARLGGIAIVGPCARTDANFVAPAASSPLPPAARTPLPDLRPFVWLHSFSSLTRRAAVETVESAAADETELPGEPEVPRQGIEDARLQALDMWRGRHFGDAVHKVLEEAPAMPVRRDWLASRFAALAVHPREQASGDALESVAQLLERTCTADLGDGLKLAELPASARVAEFEFQFPVATSVSQLRALCAEYGCAHAIPEHVSAATLNGMLTGFVDLVFEHRGRYHVLDYKTNRLGLCLDDYSGAALDAAMAAHRYSLQALLYTVALHRYLRVRLRGYAPKQHLGESWYLFLRAVGLTPDLGVWRRRWPDGLIEALDEAFASRIAA